MFQILKQTKILNIPVFPKYFPGHTHLLRKLYQEQVQQLDDIVYQKLSLKLITGAIFLTKKRFKDKKKKKNTHHRT